VGLRVPRDSARKLGPLAKQRSRFSASGLADSVGERGSQTHWLAGAIIGRLVYTGGLKLYQGWKTRLGVWGMGRRRCVRRDGVGSFPRSRSQKQQASAHVIERAADGLGGM
jgi:hypothetical protein